LVVAATLTGVDTTQRSALDGRFTISHEGRVVARAGSMAGLRAAIRDLASVTEPTATVTISIAFVTDGREWLTEWAQAGDKRTLHVFDDCRPREYFVQVARLEDPSGVGLVYEARVDMVRELPADTDLAVHSRARRAG
jgi:hypothetical protein